MYFDVFTKKKKKLYLTSEYLFGLTFREDESEGVYELPA